MCIDPTSVVSVTLVLASSARTFVLWLYGCLSVWEGRGGGSLSLERKPLALRLIGFAIENGGISVPRAAKKRPSWSPNRNRRSALASRPTATGWTSSSRGNGVAMRFRDIKTKARLKAAIQAEWANITPESARTSPSTFGSPAIRSTSRPPADDDED